MTHFGVERTLRPCSVASQAIPVNPDPLFFLFLFLLFQPTGGANDVHQVAHHHGITLTCTDIHGYSTWTPRTSLPPPQKTSPETK
jgi:hypothetical protein